MVWSGHLSSLLAHALLQVTFSTSHFKLGDPRLDKDFTLDLKAHLGSKVSKKPRLVDSAGPAGAGAAASTKGSTASTAAAPKEIRMVSLPSSKEVADTTAAASEAGAGEQAVVLQYSAAGGPPGLSSPAAAAGGPGQASLSLQQPHWEQESSLKCSVSLDMRLRLPHPLSIVPRPLLSTAASLVAKLTMQALLPSFLELLSTDYSRWAAGSSTSSRQAVAAGNLVPVPSDSSAGVQGKAGGAVVEVLEGVTTSEEEDGSGGVQAEKKQAGDGVNSSVKGAGTPAPAGSM